MLKSPGEGLFSVVLVFQTNLVCFGAVGEVSYTPCGSYNTFRLREVQIEPLAKHCDTLLNYKVGYMTA